MALAPLLGLALLCGAAAWRSFDVLAFGARGDNASDDGAAIAAAYAACREAGGGEVLFPGGGRIYRSGPLRLACNHSVTRLQPGAVLAARNSTEGWPFGPDCPEPAQGRSPRQMAPLVSVEWGLNVTITGGGELDGNGEMWWAEHCGNWWCPPGYPPTRPKAFRPFLLRADHTRRLRVANVSMRNPGFWNLVPVRCEDVTIEGVNVSASWSSEAAARAAPHAEAAGAGAFDPFAATPNTDGFEPMWSSGVTVRNCRVLNGDDCITVKSGSRDVLVEDLYCEHGDGLTVGSVWYEDVTNVTYRRVVMNRTHNGPMIKGRSQGNATVSLVRFEDVSLIEVYLALTVDCLYETPGSVVPNKGVHVHDVIFRNISGSVAVPREHPYNPGGGGDPTLLTDAAGTFFCREPGQCSLSLSDVRIWHSVEESRPPVWACNNSEISLGGTVSPLPTGKCAPRDTAWLV